MCGVVGGRFGGGGGGGGGGGEGGGLVALRGVGRFGSRGGGGTASLRVGTHNKNTDPRFCATTALSHCPCWFTAPCF